MTTVAQSLSKRRSLKISRKDRNKLENKRQRIQAQQVSIISHYIPHLLKYAMLPETSTTKLSRLGSRCTSLDGLVLKQPLRPSDIIVDDYVCKFANGEL